MFEYYSLRIVLLMCVCMYSISGGTYIKIGPWRMILEVSVATIFALYFPSILTIVVAIYVLLVGL